VKDFLKLSLYQLIYYAVRCVPASPGTNHLLLVKTDEIGDYILIRNLLPLFRQSGPYENYKITFVGNSAFRQIFSLYDQQVADEVIWLDKKRFSADLLYRFRLLLLIRKIGASDAISLVYSRIFRKDDVIMAVSAAPARTAMNHNNRLITAYERRLTPKHIYTRLEDAGEDTLFDANRNARFIERLLQLPPRPVTTEIAARADIRADIGSFSLPQAYFVIFPGSGIPEKKWPPASFSTVAQHLARQYRLVPVVCGSAADAADCREFIRACDAPVIDLTTKTSLPQLLEVLRGAACLVSVDTGSVHLAAAVGCPVFALYSGLHYGRFAPYPESIAAHFYPVYPDQVDSIIRDKRPVDFQLIPIDLLKEITPAKLIAKIDEFLPGINLNLKKIPNEGII